MAEIAKANDINVSGAELTKYVAEQTAELSDADLEAVAGGAWTDDGTTDALVGGGVGFGVVWGAAVGLVIK